MTGRIKAVSLSSAKGVKKNPSESVNLLAGAGVEGDAHADGGHRQVSLLASESIEKMRSKGLAVGPGDFAENITTVGIPLASLPVGTILNAGSSVSLKVTQIGKECHARCNIYHAAGDCIMPKEGIFAEVITGGTLKPGDSIAMQGNYPVFGDITGALGDFGMAVPILLTLASVNVISLHSALFLLGVSYMASSLFFRIPFPVQPLKAAVAIVIARGLGPAMLKYCAIWMGIIFLLLPLSGLTNKINRFFSRTLIRGLQLGAGLLLLKGAIKLFNSGYTPPAAAALSGTIIPSNFAEFWSAFFILVIPQLPLTLGNAVAATCDTAKQYFPHESSKVTPKNVSLSIGCMNMLGGILGGVPSCHGSAGLTAHYRLGARTKWSTFMLGTAFVLIAFTLQERSIDALKTIPHKVLAVMLAYTGLRHALLAIDRASIWPIAVIMGLLGILTQNLTSSIAAGIIFERLMTKRSSKIL